MTYDGQKRKIQFYNPATVDTDPSELVYVVISATPQMLDEIGGLTFASGSRFPAKEQYSNFPFNEETRQELIYIGLQLMGAAELSFDGDWSDSLDDDFHLTWEQDSTDKGLWHLHLNNPIVSDGTDGREIELDKGTTYIRWRYVGDSSWINLVSLTELTGPAGADGASGADGTDGNDGVDGREVDFRVSGGYIQWEYVTGDTWHNLVSLATLTGPQGPAGADGADGADGEDGADGTDVSTPPDHGMTPSDETRCSVSVAVVNYIYGVFTGSLRMDSTARSEIVSGSGGIGLALGLIFPGLGAVIAAGVAGAALYATLLDIEANGYIPYFDTDVKDDLKCKLYCLLDNDGLYTEAVHDAFKAQISESSEPLYDAIWAVMDKAGYKPFQWGALSAPLLASPDCTGCDDTCSWTFKALGGNGNYDKLVIFDGQDGQTYTSTYSGDKIYPGLAANTGYYFSVAVPLEGAYITYVKMHFNKNNSSGGICTRNGNIGNNPSGDTGLGGGTEFTWEITPNQTLTNVVGVLGGFSTDNLDYIEVRGTGTPPAGLF